MMNLVPDINLSEEGPLVQATANMGRESRRRMRVENVDFPGHRQRGQGPPMFDSFHLPKHLTRYLAQLNVYF